jgi:hypothetical protein
MQHVPKVKCMEDLCVCYLISLMYCRANATKNIGTRHASSTDADDSSLNSNMHNGDCKILNC